MLNNNSINMKIMVVVFSFRGFFHSRVQTPFEPCLRYFEVKFKIHQFHHTHRIIETHVISLGVMTILIDHHIHGIMLNQQQTGAKKKRRASRSISMIIRVANETCFSVFYIVFLKIIKKNNK